MNSMPEQSHSDDQINDSWRKDCPEWCAEDHTDDDPTAPGGDLIGHLGNDHADNVRGLIEHAHTLDIRIGRVDCPPESRYGTPALLIRADIELTTWEQAAELARTILDAFGHLESASWVCGKCGKPTDWNPSAKNCWRCNPEE